MSWATSEFKSLESAENPLGYRLAKAFMVDYDKIDWISIFRGYRGKRLRRLILDMKAFVRHVRETKCYDVDYCPPTWIKSPFVPLNFFLDKEGYSSWINGGAEFAVSKLNAVTPPDHTFKLVAVEKAVTDFRYRTLLLTFAVKLVEEDTTLIFQASVDTKTDPANHCRLVDPKDYVLEDLRLRPDSDSDSSSAKDNEEDIPEDDSAEDSDPDSDEDFF